MSLYNMFAGCSFVSISSSIPWSTRSRVPGIYLVMSASYLPVDINYLICCTFSPAFKKFEADLQKIPQCCQKVRQWHLILLQFLFFFASLHLFLFVVAVVVVDVVVLSHCLVFLSLQSWVFLVVPVLPHY